MSWFKIDDGWWAHPKTLALSPQAVALWCRAGSWSSQQLTDGYISTGTLRLFGYKVSAVQELVRVGYWTEVQDGYQFHDWDQYQPTAEEVREKRDRARERMRNVRANRQGTSGEVPLTPTRPDPTRPVKEEPNGSSGRTSPAKRAHSIPADFAVTDAMRAWAGEKVPGVDVGRETQKFIDWHMAKGSTFKDWTAAWRTWMNKAADFTAAAKPQQQTWW